MLQPQPGPELPPVDNIVIAPFDAHHAADSARLHRAWLNDHGFFEEADLDRLERPQESMLAPGGEIFFALADGAVAGTCAAIPSGDAAVELAKLAVAAPLRGRGLGRRLSLAAIEWARCGGAGKVVLVSSARLGAVLRLYESLGFCLCATATESRLRQRRRLHGVGAAPRGREAAAAPSGDPAAAAAVADGESGNPGIDRGVLLFGSRGHAAVQGHRYSHERWPALTNPQPQLIEPNTVKEGQRREARTPPKYRFEREQATTRVMGQSGRTGTGTLR